MLRDGRPVVVDEIQRYPELFSWIQVISDERQENGLFLLDDHISQSLAGRTAVLTLLPLSIRELRSPPDLSIDQRLCAARVGQLLNTSTSASDW